MKSVGFKLKLTRLWHRMVASYLRAIGVGLGTLQIGDALGAHLDLALASQVGASLLGALIGPLAVFLTEAADLIETTDDTPDQ